MSTKTIGVLHVSWSLAVGGLERMVWSLVRSAPAMGLRPEVAVMTGGGHLLPAVEAAGARVHVLDKRPGLRPDTVWRLAAIARAMDADILHAHNQGAMLYAGLAGLLCGRPVIGTRHGASRTGQMWGPQRRYRALSRLVGRLCRYTVCVGADSLRVAAQIDRLPPARLRLIHNGVDTAIFRPDSQLRAQTRAALGLADDQAALVGVGRLAPEKDFALALEALALAELPRAVLLIVGEGAERPALERLIASRGLAGRARLLGNRDDVPALLAAADVMVNSSLSEGLSLAILEGMSAGLPVAATAVGGTAEMVTDGVTGLLSPAGDAAALARSMVRLAGDRPTAVAMGQRGRQTVLERFSLEAMAKSYAQLYAQALGRA